jgi:hypothetical protein
LSHVCAIFLANRLIPRLAQNACGGSLKVKAKYPNKTRKFMEKRARSSWRIKDSRNTLEDKKNHGVYGKIMENHGRSWKHVTHKITRVISEN